MCEADEPGGGWSPRSAARACPSGPLPARRRCPPRPDSCHPTNRGHARLSHEGSGALKRPKRTIAGCLVWSRYSSCSSSTSHGTEEPSVPQVRTVGAGRTPRSPPDPGAAGVRRTKGMRRGSPTQQQGRTHPPQLPPGRRGGRPLARLAQDRVPLGQGRQAAVPQDPGRPPPLPRGRDPRPGRRTSRGSKGLTVRSSRTADPDPGEACRPACTSMDKAAKNASLGLRRSRAACENGA
jgi:hypothetical protein